MLPPDPAAKASTAARRCGRSRKERASAERVFGIDFTSRPRAGRSGKSIVVAHARLEGEALVIERLQSITEFTAFETFLATPGPWVGGFDFPFGLPRTFANAQGLADWPAAMRWVRSLDRERFCAVTFEAFSAARGNPAAKHRAIDLASGSHSPLKTMDPVRRIAINPPVGLMLFEGASRLHAAGLHLPGQHETGDARVALEVYPGWLAIALGERHYKNDKPSSGSTLREARQRLLAGLRAGHSLLPVRVPAGIARTAVDDASGDSLDAVLCAVAAGWAARQGAPRYGLPPFDPVEGWIVGVPAPAVVGPPDAIARAPRP